MGSLRTELQIPSTYQTAQSNEECGESDDDAEEEEEVEGADDMLLGSAPSESLQVWNNFAKIFSMSAIAPRQITLGSHVDYT